MQKGASPLFIQLDSQADIMPLVSAVMMQKFSPTGFSSGEGSGNGLFE
jgi:hypothetical protein